MLLALGAGLVGIAFILSAGFCMLVRRWAPRLGLVDRPGGRKAHKAPTPMGGGVAIWLTVVAVLGAGGVVLRLESASLPPALREHVGGLWERAPELVTILALATAIMVMGLIDDRVGLDWRPRLAIQIGLATLAVAAGVRVSLYLSGDFAWLARALSVLWIVGLTNAFNFLDNMDGLAAGVGLIAASLFAAAQVGVGSLFVPGVLLVVVGALAGFLVHNHTPARLFMGDAGSNFLGFLLGCLTVAGTFSRRGYPTWGVLAPLLVMAVPLYDTTSVVLIRLREGRSPFQADRRHFSHRLVDRGLTPLRAVWTINLVTLACGLGALLLHRVDAFGAGVVVAQTACLLGVVAILEISSTTQSTERSHGQASEAPEYQDRPDSG